MGCKSACVLAITLVACASEEAAPATASIEMDPFVVQPGEQGLMCQTFANPFGRDVEVAAWSATIARGGHHVLLFQVDDPPGPAGDCSSTAVAGGAPVLFQSQDSGQQELVYPEGVAALLLASATLMMQTHYLNAEDEAVTVDNAIVLTEADPGSVTAHLGSLLFQTFDIAVPPHDTSTSTQRCTVSDDVDLVWLTSHMHQHGTEFAAALDGTRIYDSKTSGDPVVTVFDPPRPASTGAELRFDCTYSNMGDTSIGFGKSLVDDEMCVLVGAYVARAGGEPPALECALPEGECLKCAGAFAPGASGELCTDDGPPSSAEAYAAMQACSCETGCAAECAASACAGAAPDDACFACMGDKCNAEITACFGG